MAQLGEVWATGRVVMVSKANSDLCCHSKSEYLELKYND